MNYLFREEIYTDLIQEYDHLSHEEVTDMVDVKVMDLQWWILIIGCLSNYVQSTNLSWVVTTVSKQSIIYCAVIVYIYT